MLSRTTRRLGKDPFKSLGLTRTASKVEVKRKYRELAMQHHPDQKDGDATKMEEVNRAYNVLMKEGGYERLHLKSPGGGGGGGGAAAASRSRAARGAGAGAYGEAPPSQDMDAPDGWSADEYSKVAALDPETERVMPNGKYMYQNRDTGEFVTLSRPLFKAKQPRYGGFSAKATDDLKEQLRNLNTKKERDQSSKGWHQRMQDDLADQLVSKSRMGYWTTLLAYAICLYFGWLATNRYLERRVERNEFYEEHAKKDEQITAEMQEQRDISNMETAAAAIIFAAAAAKKLDADPLVPTEPYDTASTSRPRHFSTIVNPS